MSSGRGIEVRERDGVGADPGMALIAGPQRGDVRGVAGLRTMGTPAWAIDGATRESPSDNETTRVRMPGGGAHARIVRDATDPSWNPLVEVRKSAMRHVGSGCRFMHGASTGGTQGALERPFEVGHVDHVLLQLRAGNRLVALSLIEPLRQSLVVDRPAEAPPHPRTRERMGLASALVPEFEDRSSVSLRHLLHRAAMVDRGTSLWSPTATLTQEPFAKPTHGESPPDSRAQTSWLPPFSVVDEGGGQAQGWDSGPHPRG